MSQDIVVLGKNGQHSFGRAQDQIPSPTLTHQLEAIFERIGETNWKRNQETPAREQPLMRVRVRSEKIGLNLKLVRCVKKRHDSKDVN